MGVPLILLVGPAGSGKNTVADYLEREFQATQIAQADPLKRFAQKIFGFTNFQLWGPSTARNATVPEDLLPSEETLDRLVWEHGPDFIHETMPASVDARNAQTRLVNVWLGKCCEAMHKGNLSPRLALQLLGTEWGRSLHGQVWVEYAHCVAMKLLSGGYWYQPNTGLVHDPGRRGADYVVITDGRFQNEVVGALAINGVAWKIEGRSSQLGSNASHQSETELTGIPRHWFNATIKNDGDFTDLHHKVRQALLTSGFNDSRAADDIAGSSTSLPPDVLMRRAGN